MTTSHENRDRDSEACHGNCCDESRAIRRSLRRAYTLHHNGGTWPLGQISAENLEEAIDAAR